MLEAKCGNCPRQQIAEVSLALDRPILSEAGSELIRFELKIVEQACDKHHENESNQENVYLLLDSLSHGFLFGQSTSL